MWPDKDGGLETNKNVCSDVVVMDDRAVASVVPPAPVVSTLNVTKSSKVHIGTKIVSVTQNVHNVEVIKGRFMGLELVSSNHSRRVRCSVAVFICWALLVATGLIIYLIYVALPKQTRLDVGLNETWYLRRRDWQAMPPYGINFLELPVSYVIIGHSAAAFCNQKYDCIEKVLEIQQNHLRRDFDDIGPNFLVGGEGWVFEGRGANVFGAMLPTYNRISVSIMFIGDYEQVEPDQSQFNHTKILLDVLVKIGVLHPDYTIWGQCQVNPYTISPGRNLIDNLHYLPHWNSSNTHVCLRR